MATSHCRLPRVGGSGPQGGSRCALRSALPTRPGVRRLVSQPQPARSHPFCPAPQAWSPLSVSPLWDLFSPPDLAFSFPFSVFNQVTKRPPHTWACVLASGLSRGCLWQGAACAALFCSSSCPLFKQLTPVNTSTKISLLT